MGSRHGNLASGARAEKGNKLVTRTLKENELMLLSDKEGTR
jgi:hypothetical protein